MFIQTEHTPNPDVLKFLPGQDVLKDGTAEFTSPEETAEAPLAAALFRIEGVARVFYGRNFISVTKVAETDWDLLKARVLSAIMDHYLAGRPVITSAQTTPEARAIPENEDEIVTQIKELLETRVRPAVAMDGGDIAFDRFEDGIVYLHMQGACAGCPSSSATLKMGIENMLRHYIPEVEEVRPVT